MGFVEKNPKQVRSSLHLSEDGILTSNHSDVRIQCGDLQIPSLAELRSDSANNVTLVPSGPLKVSEVVTDVQQLHKDPVNAGALFQVASQFNLLEMASPQAIPENGVGIYGYDRTQGPACAIACSGGTIYRNYYAPVRKNGRTMIGQTAKHQVDCLVDMGVALGNSSKRLWKMKNGYVLATKEGLEHIHHQLFSCSDSERDEYLQLLRIGIQKDTQVTLGGCKHTVTQAYCSALPISYGQHPVEKWEAFARLILEASYEATFHAAILNAASTRNNKVFLTLVGGGVFGNKEEWILDAIEKCLNMFADYALDVNIVSYGRPNDAVLSLVKKFEKKNKESAEFNTGGVLNAECFVVND